MHMLGLAPAAEPARRSPAEAEVARLDVADRKFRRPRVTAPIEMAAMS